LYCNREKWLLTFATNAVHIWDDRTNWPVTHQLTPSSSHQRHRLPSRRKYNRAAHSPKISSLDVYNRGQQECFQCIAGFAKCSLARKAFPHLARVFNNYYDGVKSYGVGSSMGAAVLVEGNYFRNVPTPFLSASGVGESGPGYLMARDNVFADFGATREQNEPQLVLKASDF
jgi:hypothetical protein